MEAWATSFRTHASQGVGLYVLRSQGRCTRSTCKELQFTTGLVRDTVKKFIWACRCKKPEGNWAKPEVVLSHIWSSMQAGCRLLTKTRVKEWERTAGHTHQEVFGLSVAGWQVF